MLLDPMLVRCRRLEERAAALYRGFAAGAREDPELCALWTALAREETQHARSLESAQRRLEAGEATGTRVDGWDEALAEAERRLADAERVEPGAPRHRQLAAALDLETSELDSVRLTLLELAGEPDLTAHLQADHALRLAEAATRLTADPHVRLQAALVRARALLKEEEQREAADPSARQANGE
jgi:rubrerythrin